MSDTYNTQTSQMKAIKDNATVINDFINGSNSGSDSNRIRPKASKHTLPRSDVIDALSKIQPVYKSEYIVGQKTNINTDKFKSALLNSIATINPSANTRSVNQIDGHTIDFVEMIFGAFLRDKNISSAIKALLLKLQIPVIKIAMLDTKFFYNHKHPARNVLDEIAHIGIGIDDAEAPVLKTIELISDQLLNSFDKNIISFHTALKALNRLRLIEQGKQDDNEKQTKKNILKEHARQSVLTSLQYHIGVTNLPKALQPLILKQWSTLMFHRFIRFGKDSTQWAECTDILNEILTGIRKAKTHADLLKIKNSQPNLHHEVEALLHETKLNKEHIHNAVNTLKLNIKRNIIISEEHLKTVSIDNEHAPQKLPVNAEEQELNKAKNKISQLPMSVKSGTWFEVYTGENKAIRRLKLSVIIMDTAKLVFVDRMGIKVIEKDADEFSKEIENDRSRFLADHSIFNHALSNVIMSLSNQ